MWSKANHTNTRAKEVKLYKLYTEESIVDCGQVGSEGSIPTG